MNSVDVEPVPPSGVRESGECLVQPSTLSIAMAYWPGRWSRDVELLAASLFPFVDPLDPKGWAALLDRIAHLDAAEEGAR